MVKQATRKSKSTKTRAGKSKASKAKTSRKKTKSAVADQEVTIDRRRSSGRRPEDSEKVETPVASAPGPKLERRKKVNRRRQIDPTTCERDYTDDEIQFMNALEQYKRTSGRMFPTCSEVLEVIRSLGYVQLNPAELAVRQATVIAEVEITLNEDDTALDTEEAEESEESTADFELAY